MSGALAAAQERIAELEAALGEIEQAPYTSGDTETILDRILGIARAALAGSQGGGGEFTAAEREAIISGSLTVPRATVERAMAQATTDAETTAPECRDGWHAIRPGEGACICGENRMELML